MAAQNKRAANDGDSTKVVEPQTPEGKLDQTQPVPTNADGNNETASRSAIDLTDLESKRVPDLRAMCRGLNLRAHGRKHALITRIREAQQDRSPSQTVVVLEDDIDDDDVEAAHASPHHETQD